MATMEIETITSATISFGEFTRQRYGAPPNEDDTYGHVLVDIYDYLARKAICNDINYILRVDPYVKFMGYSGTTSNKRTSAFDLANKKKMTIVCKETEVVNKQEITDGTGTVYRIVNPLENATPKVEAHFMTPKNCQLWMMRAQTREADFLTDAVTEWYNRSTTYNTYIVSRSAIRDATDHLRNQHQTEIREMKMETDVQIEEKDVQIEEKNEIIVQEQKKNVALIETVQDIQQQRTATHALFQAAFNQMELDKKNTQATITQLTGENENLTVYGGVLEREMEEQRPRIADIPKNANKQETLVVMLIPGTNGSKDFLIFICRQDESVEERKSDLAKKWPTIVEIDRYEKHPNAKTNTRKIVDYLTANKLAKYDLIGGQLKPFMTNQGDVITKRVDRTQGYRLEEGVIIKDIVASFNPWRNETDMQDEEAKNR